ncbi:MAG: AsmA family protein [Acidobacteriia bacterium]|nr:AsmA family protein [Terriglobia bacterium]
MPNDKRRRFGVLKISGIVVALLLIAIIAVPLFLDANQFRPELESRLTGALGRDVKIGNLKLSLFSGGVAADNIAIADDPRFSKSPFVQAQSLRVGVELKPLIFSRAVRVTSIALEKPEITLVRSAAGDWNFSSLGGKSHTTPAAKPDEGRSNAAGTDVSVSLLEITDGRVTVVRGGSRLKPYIYDKVNITARNLSSDSVFPFTLTASLPGGGSAKLEGKAGPINNADVSLTPFDATLAISHFDLVASGFIEPGSGLGGLIDFSCSLISDGRQAQTKGHATADKLQLVKGGAPAGRPVSLDYTLDYRLNNQTGTLSEARVGCGKAVARLSGSYDTRGDSMVLNMKLRGEEMPVPDLEALLPAAGITLPRGASLQGGTLSADLATAGPIEKLVTTGTVDISRTQLAGFDLGAKMAAVASLAGLKPSGGTEIEKLASGLRVTPDGIQVSGLSLIVPSLGQLTGDGILAADHSLDFKMLARLNASASAIGSLARLGGSSGLNVPFFIRGTTSDPAFSPDLKGVAGSLLDSVKGKNAPASGSSVEDVLRGLLGKKKK